MFFCLFRHGAALKKNISNLARRVLSDDKPTAAIASESEDGKHNNNEIIISKPPSIKSRKFSEAVDIEAVMSVPVAQAITKNGNSNDGKEVETPKYQIIQANSTNISLKTISLTYGWSQVMTALVGGFAVTPAGKNQYVREQRYCISLTNQKSLTFNLPLTTPTPLSPSVAASPTMFTLGAEGLAPQIGSVLLLLIFYVTDFQIVGYIPKPAFSSMLVLCFIDMINTWFYKSFFKTKDKLEWMVVPVSNTTSITMTSNSSRKQLFNC